MNTSKVINVVSGELNDFTTTYDIADGDAVLTIPATNKGNMRVEVIVGEFDYPVGTTNGTDFSVILDSTVALYSSDDGINYQAVDGANILLVNSAKKKGGWEKNEFESNYIHIVIKQNSAVAGTLRITYNFKN